MVDTLPISKPSRNLTAIVQVTDDCNLRCKYCFVPEGNHQQMSQDVFKRCLDVFDEFVGPNGNISLIYHGGEPLTRGIDFFKFAQAEIDARGGSRRIMPSMQTNATLIDDVVAEYLLASNIHFGVSIDGPFEIHNANRVRCDGQGSFDDVMKGIDALRRHSYTPNAIAVFTKKSISNISQIYDFFNTEGINFKINPIDLTSTCDTIASQLRITPVEYGKALIELFDIWFNDTKSNIHIGNFDDSMAMLTKNQVCACSYSTGSCGTSYIGIVPNGDVYPCNRFSAIPSFKIGNVIEKSLDELFSSPLMGDFRARRTTLATCLPCDYYSVCHGGCSSNAFSGSGTVLSKDHYCVSTKLLLNHVSQILYQHVESAKSSA